VIALGIYENGEVWTDVAGLGAKRARRLASELARQQVVLDVTKRWAFWRAGRGKLNLAAADPVLVAEAVRSAPANNPVAETRAPVSVSLPREAWESRSSARAQILEVISKPV
jgi:hypothetical protein